MSAGSPRTVTVFAPASVGNVAVGFDILGHAITGVGDRVTISRSAEPGIHIISVAGIIEDLPRDPAANTATRGLPGLCRKLGVSEQFDVSIDKGIPLGSGIGGSAASAVAGVVALHEFLGAPLTQDELLTFAIEGESASSPDVSADNVAPSLMGGLVLITEGPVPGVCRLPAPDVIRCVVVRPHISIETRRARYVLNSDVPLRDAVRQASCLGGFVAGCYENDIDLIGNSLKDLLIEPQRKHLIPGFDTVKSAALDQGALGCSISGSGPSVFAWCEERLAETVATAMADAFATHKISAESRISAIEPVGAHVTRRSECST